MFVFRIATSARNIIFDKFYPTDKISLLIFSYTFFDFQMARKIQKDI